MRQAPKIATNDHRRYDFVVDVHPGSGPAARVEVSDTFAITGLKPGAGGPRYGLKALRTQQDKEHQALLDQPAD